MKPLLLLIPVLLTVSAARHKEKKTTLEDVERDYITTKARLSPPPAPKHAKSPTQFGFVPVKTAANYVQKEPKVIYAQSDINVGHQGKSQYNTIAYSSPQQYSPGSQQYSPAPQQYSPASQQYSPASPQYSSASQQYSPSSQQYSPGPQHSSKQQYSPGNQQYSTDTKYSFRPHYNEVGAQKSQAHTQAFYVPQGQQGHYLNNYDNLQNIADNSVDQGGQQYYNPQQYYYLQQYQAPTTSIQAVVDPKGGLQYIMYIPTFTQTQTADQTQNYENIVYANGEQSYQQPDFQDETYSDKQQSQYNTYSDDQNSYEIGKTAYTPKGEFGAKREPKSLLDSYVPSLLQLQYYKQAHTDLNRLQDNQKYSSYSPISSESSHRYSYRQTPVKR